MLITPARPVCYVVFFFRPGLTRTSALRARLISVSLHSRTQIPPTFLTSGTANVLAAMCRCSVMSATRSLVAACRVEYCFLTTQVYITLVPTIQVSQREKGTFVGGGFLCCHNEGPKTLPVPLTYPDLICAKLYFSRAYQGCWTQGSRQLMTTNMEQNPWRLFDNSLFELKIRAPTRELRERAEAEKRRVRFEFRKSGNVNTFALEHGLQDCDLKALEEWVALYAQACPRSVEYLWQVCHSRFLSA